MVRSQFIKTAITFAAGTGVGFAANAKYHGQGKASKMIRVPIRQSKVVNSNFYESLAIEVNQGRYRRNNEILTEIYDPDSARDP